VLEVGMIVRSVLTGLLLSLVLFLGDQLNLARADSAVPASPAQVSPLSDFANSADLLAGTLKSLLIQLLPEPLYAKDPGWGKKRGSKNDGLWRKVRVSAPDPEHLLQVAVRDLHWEKDDHLAFTLGVAFDVRVNAEQQKWQAGVRLYSTSVQARLRVKLTLRCDAAMRVEMAGGLFPDLILSFKVLDSKVAYDHLVVEHVAGIGGTGARWLGELARATIHEFWPAVERRLLDRASAALVKSGNEREVRIGLSKLFSAKGKS
jgi:hypothetical protein